MVEYSTHNGTVTGSSPVRPNIMKTKTKLFLKKTNVVYTDTSAVVLPTAYKHKNFFISADIFQKQFFKNIKVINVKG